MSMNPVLLEAILFLKNNCSYWQIEDLCTATIARYSECVSEKLINNV